MSLEEIKQKKMAIADFIMKRTMIDNVHLSENQHDQLELAMRCLTSAEETEKQIMRSLPVSSRQIRGLAAYELS